jgi:hypothetical protein
METPAHSVLLLARRWVHVELLWNPASLLCVW